jgi:hypothetical protein
LAVIAEAALRFHQRAIAAKKIHLIKELPGDLTGVVYATEILQVVSNLLANALYALPENGILRIRLRKSQSRIHILIGDNGHGIPQENRAEIFKPFSRQRRIVGMDWAYLFPETSWNGTAVRFAFGAVCAQKEAARRSKFHFHAESIQSSICDIHHTRSCIARRKLP